MCLTNSVFFFMEGISSNKSYNRIEYCIFTSSDFIRTKDSTHWHTLQKRCYFPEKKNKIGWGEIEKS